MIPAAFLTPKKPYRKRSTHGRGVRVGSHRVPGQTTAGRPLFTASDEAKAETPSSVARRIPQAVNNWDSRELTRGGPFHEKGIVAEGMIPLDHAPAHWGFTSAAFHDSWLWRQGNIIFISMIIAVRPGQGDFSRLVKAIRADGFQVKVPLPSNQMREICQRWEFHPTQEDSEYGPVEVWGS